MQSESGKDVNVSDVALFYSEGKVLPSSGKGVLAGQVINGPTNASGARLEFYCQATCNPDNP